MGNEMEWYSGSDFGELVVPKDYEPMDRLLSPNSWSGWGISAFGDFESPKKHCRPKSNPTLAEPELDFCDFSSEINGRNCSFLGEDLSDSNVCQTQWTSSEFEQPDVMLDDFASIEPMDETFRNSFLEDDVNTVGSLHEAFSFPHRSYNELMPTDNLFCNSSLEQKNVPHHIYDMQRSLGDVNTSSIPSKVPMVNNPGSSEHDRLNGHIEDETTVEESVLQGLEDLTTQLTDEVRICFRDAFYRLARNSESKTSKNKDEDTTTRDNIQLTICDETSSIAGISAAERRTNAIDRTVANLLFSNKSSSGENRPTTTPYSVKQEATGANEQSDNIVAQEHSSSSYCYTGDGGDAEVPISGRHGLQTFRKNGAAQILNQ